MARFTQCGLFVETLPLTSQRHVTRRRPDRDSERKFTACLVAGLRVTSAVRCPAPLRRLLTQYSQVPQPGSFEIERPTIDAGPAYHVDSCPVTIKFSVTITASDAGTV